MGPIPLNILKHLGLVALASILENTKRRGAQQARRGRNTARKVHNKAGSRQADMMETILAAPWQMWATLAIILVTIVFYTLDRFPLELISAGAIVALMLLFLLAPMQANGENLLTTDRKSVV